MQIFQCSSFVSFEQRKCKHREKIIINEQRVFGKHIVVLLYSYSNAVNTHILLHLWDLLCKRFTDNRISDANRLRWLSSELPCLNNAVNLRFVLMKLVKAYF